MDREKVVEQLHQEAAHHRAVADRLQQAADVLRGGRKKVRSGNVPHRKKNESGSLAADQRLIDTLNVTEEITPEVSTPSKRAPRKPK